MNINRIINDALRDALTTKLSRGNGRSKLIKSNGTHTPFFLLIRCIYTKVGEIW